MYIYQIEDDIEIKLFTHNMKDKIKNFYCGNDALDKFIQHDALSSDKYEDYRTYVFVLKDQIIGYFALSAKGMTMSIGPQYFNMPAIELSYFALDEQYHHIYYDEEAEKDNDRFYLSDVLLIKILTYIKEKIYPLVGIRYITLYSVPLAEDLYRRNDFVDFESVMLHENKSYLDGCIPLYTRLCKI